MICPTCGKQTTPRNHNGRGWRCNACWARLDLTLHNLESVDPEWITPLQALSVRNIPALAGASPELLQRVKGIGEKTAHKLIDAARKVIL